MASWVNTTAQAVTLYGFALDWRQSRSMKTDARFSGLPHRQALAWLLGPSSSSFVAAALIFGAPNRGLPTAFQTGILDSASAETIMNRRELELAALAAADRGLKGRGYMALDEVFRDMGKLEAKDWEDWRRGKVPYLERVIRLNLSQINAVCRAVHASARRGTLKPSWTA